MANITIGQYLPFDSFIHKLDPRVKIVGVFLYIITIFFVKDFLTYIPFIVLLIVVLSVAKIPLKAILRSLKPLIFIIVITGVINLFTTPGKEVFTIWKFSVTEEGLYRTAFTILRLVLIILSTSVLTYTTSPMELTYGLEKLFSPLKKFGFPAGELAMMISISLRFIPTLFDEANKIKMAQMARGADFESGNIFDRAVSMIPLLVPLFINALKRSGDLATAMEARLYRIGEERTKLNEIYMDKKDWLSIIGFTIFCAIIIILYLVW